MAFQKRSRDKGPRIPTTIKTMGVNITTIDYLRFLIIEIGSTFISMVVEVQGRVVEIPLFPRGFLVV